MAKAQKKTVQAIEAKTVATNNEVTEKKGRAVVEPIVLTKSQQKDFEACTTLSAKIRFLNKEGFSNGQIAKFVSRKYQHVRNVLTTPMKRASATKAQAQAQA